VDNQNYQEMIHMLNLNNNHFPLNNAGKQNLKQGHHLNNHVIMPGTAGGGGHYGHAHNAGGA
jgi:hypothetical protein